MSQQNWQNAYEDQNPNEAYSEFSDNFSQVHNYNVPLIAAMTKVNSNNNNKTPFTYLRELGQK